MNQSIMRKKLVGIRKHCNPKWIEKQSLKCRWCLSQSRTRKGFESHLKSVTHLAIVDSRFGNRILESYPQPSYPQAYEPQRNQVEPIAAQAEEVEEEEVEPIAAAAQVEENRDDYWLCGGLVVKVISKNQKGVVVNLISKYVGQVKMLGDKDAVILVHQYELQTVIPNIGGLIRILNGKYCGQNAKLVSADLDSLSAKVQIEGDAYDGTLVDGVGFDDICKIVS